MALCAVYRRMRVRAPYAARPLAASLPRAQALLHKPVYIAPAGSGPCADVPSQLGLRV